ncbi:glycoside hydrolase, partial [Stenotrophomonas maltophilia]
MQARKLTLVEIGVGGLPSASPVAPRFSTWFPVPFKAPDVPPANGVNPTPVADGVVLEWDAVDLEGVIYVISRSESQDGPWTEIHRTTETRYVYSDGSGKTWWFQITPTVRGKTGTGTVVGAVPPTTSKDLAEQQAKLAAEISARIQAIADEAAARAAGLAQAAQDLVAEALLRQQGVTEAMQAISAEALARIDALLNEKMAREAAISREEQLRQSADESLARAVSEVAAGSGTQFDSIKLWPFNQTIEGWTGNGAPTLVDGWLRPANHATAPWVQSPVALAVDGSAYRFVKLRVKRVGSPAWGGSLQWITTTDQAWSTQKRAVIPEPAWDASGVATVDVQDIAWWPATVDAIRLQLGTEQSVANYFLIDYVAVGRPQPGASVAVVQAETEARISADAAEAAQRNTLAVQIRGNYTGSDPLQLTSGLAYEELKARVAADAAQVRRITIMEARMPAGEGALATAASVTSLEEATATTTGALAQSITTINASLPAIIDQGNNNAQAISDLSTKVAQHDETITSQAGLITALRSDVTDLAGTTAANTTALQQLTTRVTTAEDKIETTSQQITQLQTGVDGV